MSARKLRDAFIEFKIYFIRIAGYLTIFNFLMIALIFLNTTLWEYDFFQNIFPERKLFLLIGMSAFLVAIITLGYFDTKYKLWRAEIDKTFSGERNPTFIVYAFQCAKMINDLKKQGNDTKELEVKLNEIFARCNLTADFETFKKHTK